MSFWFKLSLYIYIFLPLIFPGNKVKGILGKDKGTNTHSEK